jgi:hypothetical protein
MRHWLLILSITVLGGCASDGYRYHQDGYWTARTPARPSIAVYGSFSSCWGGYGAAWYPYYGGWASPCTPLSYFQGPWWYGANYGYGYDPYWASRWYLPRPMNSVRAGSRARALVNETPPQLQPGNLPSYYDLAPARRRDIGGGDRAYESSARYYRPSVRSPRQPGLGSLGSSRSSGSSRSEFSRSGLSGRSTSAPLAPARTSSNGRDTRSREREEN